MKEQVNKAEFLKSRGWFQWYNENYWCHEQFGSKDCTNYGLSLNNAYEFETDKQAKTKILRGMNMVATGRKILLESL